VRRFFDQSSQAWEEVVFAPPRAPGKCSTEDAPQVPLSIELDTNKTGDSNVGPDASGRARGANQIVFFNCLDLYHKSPDSNGRQYNSRA